MVTTRQSKETVTLDSDSDGGSDIEVIDSDSFIVTRKRRFSGTFVGINGGSGNVLSEDLVVKNKGDGELEGGRRKRRKVIDLTINADSEDIIDITD